MTPPNPPICHRRSLTNHPFYKLGLSALLPVSKSSPLCRCNSALAFAVHDTCPTCCEAKGCGGEGEVQETKIAVQRRSHLCSVASQLHEANRMLSATPLLTGVWVKFLVSAHNRQRQVQLLSNIPFGSFHFQKSHPENLAQVWLPRLTRGFISQSKNKHWGNACCRGTSPNHRGSQLGSLPASQLAPNRVRDIGTW